MTPDKPDELTALGVRAAACKGWRWMPGMLPLDAEPMSRVVDLYSFNPGEPRFWATHEEQGDPYYPTEWDGVNPPIPDLSDPATLGCLLALVREVWGTTAHLVRLQTNENGPDGNLVPACWWAIATGLSSVPLMLKHDSLKAYYFLAAPTEAEALVLALEAAAGLPLEVHGATE